MVPFKGNDGDPAGVGDAAVPVMMVGTGRGPPSRHRQGEAEQQKRPQDPGTRISTPAH